MENRSKIIPTAIVVLMAFLLAPQLQQFANASSNSPYESGRDHGCDDAGISDVGDRYINQDEKGPSFHTNEFMRGYNDGYNNCSDGSSNDDGDNDGSSSTSTCDQQCRQDCANGENRLGDVASNFVPGARIVTDFFANMCLKE
jgi:hypothetical protein